MSQEEGQDAGTLYTRQQLEEALEKQKAELLKEQEAAVAQALAENERIHALSKDAEDIAQRHSFYGVKDDRENEVKEGKEHSIEVQHAIEEALERQRIELTEQKEEAIVEAVSEIQMELTTSLMGLAAEQKEEALAKQRKELEREKEAAIADALAEKEKSLLGVESKNAEEMERKFRAIETAKKEAVQEAVSNTIQSMEEEHDVVVQSLRRSSVLELEKCMSTYKEQMSNVESTKEEAVRSAVDECKLQHEEQLKEIQQKHNEKIKILESAMDDTVQELTSKSKSEQEKLQKEMEEAISKLQLLLDTKTKEYEEKIESLEGTLKESHTKEDLTNAVGEALETQRAQMTREKDDAIAEAVLQREQALTVELKTLSDKEMGEALAKQKEELNKEKEDAIVDAVALKEKTLMDKHTEDMNAKCELLEAEREDAVEKATSETKKSMEEKHASELEKGKAEYEVQMNELVIAKEEELANALKECKDQHNELTQRLKNDYEEKMEQIKADTAKSIEEITLKSNSDLDELQKEKDDALSKSQQDSESVKKELEDKIESLEKELKETYATHYNKEFIDKTVDEALEKQRAELVKEKENAIVEAVADKERILTDELKKSANEEKEAALAKQKEDLEEEKHAAVADALAEKNREMEEVITKMISDKEEGIRFAVDEALQRERESNEQRTKELLKERDDSHVMEIQKVQMKIAEVQKEFSQDSSNENNPAGDGTTGSDDNGSLLAEKGSNIEGLLKQLEGLKDNVQRDQATIARQQYPKGKRNSSLRIVTSRKDGYSSEPESTRKGKSVGKASLGTPATPTNDQRSTTPSGTRRSRTPTSNRRSRTPTSSQRSRTPNSSRRSTTPTRNRRSIGEIMTSGSDLYSDSKRYSSTIPPFFTASAAPVDAKDIRLMIVNVPVTAKLKKMAKSLKIELLDEAIENATKATHVIAGDDDHSLRRTPKLMVCLSCTSYVLHLNWLLQSYEAKAVLNPTDYLLVHDKLAENRYRFSMILTLTNGNERRKEGGLFAGWSIFFCRGVAGNNAPKEEDLNLIIKAAGGTLLTYSDLPLSYEKDRAHILVITSDPATEQQTSDHQAAELAKNGAGFYTSTWLFGCIIHQKLFGIKRGLGPIHVSNIANGTNTAKEKSKDVTPERKIYPVSDNDGLSENRKKLTVSFKDMPRYDAATDSDVVVAADKTVASNTQENVATKIPDAATEDHSGISDTPNDAGTEETDTDTNPQLVLEEPKNDVAEESTGATDKLADESTEETSNDAELQQPDEFAFKHLCERWKVDKNITDGTPPKEPKSDIIKEKDNTVVSPEEPEEFAYNSLRARWKADERTATPLFPEKSLAVSSEEPKNVISKEEDNAAEGEITGTLTEKENISEEETSITSPDESKGIIPEDPVVVVPDSNDVVLDGTAEKENVVEEEMNVTTPDESNGVMSEDPVDVVPDSNDVVLDDQAAGILEKPENCPIPVSDDTPATAISGDQLMQEEPTCVASDKEVVNSLEEPIAVAPAEPAVIAEEPSVTIQDKQPAVAKTGSSIDISDKPSDQSNADVHEKEAILGEQTTAVSEDNVATSTMKEPCVAVVEQGGITTSTEKAPDAQEDIIAEPEKMNNSAIQGTDATISDDQNITIPHKSMVGVAEEPKVGISEGLLDAGLDQASSLEAKEISVVTSMETPALTEGDEVDAVATDDKPTVGISED